MSFGCHLYVTGMYLYVIYMLLGFTRMSSLSHSYVILCHLYVTSMYSYVIHMSLVCTHMSSVCHSCVLVCHPYVTHMYLHVIRMSFVCGFTMNLKLLHSLRTDSDNDILNIT